MAGDPRIDLSSVYISQKEPLMMKRIAAIAATLILTVVILMPSGMWDVFAEPVVLKDSSRGIGVEESGSAPERDRSLQE